MRARLLAGFSLMEMMVVLLIVAIIAAASAPMVSKKMSRGSSGESPWVFTGLGNNIAYNMSGDANSSAIIGSSRYTRRDGNSPTNPRLVLSSGNDANHPALAFADSTGTFSGQINMNAATGVVTMNDQSVGNNSVAHGLGQTITGSPSGIVAIGHGITNNNAANAISIGSNVSNAGASSIAIGSNIDITRNRTINVYVGTIRKAITNANVSWRVGTIRESDRAETWDQMIEAAYRSNPNLRGCAGPWQTGDGHGGTTLYKRDISITETLNRNTTAGECGLALGSGAQAGKNSIAIGTGDVSAAENAVNIGNVFTYDGNNNYSIGALNVQSDAANNTITLGAGGQTIYIPGNLIVTGKVKLGSKDNEVAIWGQSNGWNKYFIPDRIDSSTWGEVMGRWGDPFSDRRLKNVGDKYTSGLEELKKLKLFHYTFKQDESKTPRVGVMAQDLQKVFPNAVTKGEDGYLRIRLEDMFYAVINAVKELDQRYTKLEKTIETQQNQIEKLQEMNTELEKRLAKLEKKL